MPPTPRRATSQRVLFLALGALWLQAAVGLCRAQAGATGLRLLESGPPAFAIASKETIGLNSPPQDLHLLPDGRMLVYSANELALGDGVRWEVFRLAPKALPTFAAGVAVAADGGIYLTERDGYSRLDLGVDGNWSMTHLADWSAKPMPFRNIPRFVTASGGEWFWHSGSGGLQTWKPGEQPRLVGTVDTIEHVFSHRGAHYISDSATGALRRVTASGLERVESPGSMTSADAITASVPWKEEVLVGTVAGGLRLFDGERLRPFPNSDAIAGTARINSLCATEGGMFVAAVQQVGLVFFTPEGRTLQILGRHLDHRLARITKLISTPGGAIWGLLPDGVLRVEFPSRLSSYEPLLGTGAYIAYPYRLNDRLWVMSDGRALRAEYDHQDRLVNLEPDSPVNQFVFAFSTVTGRAIAGTPAGAWYRAERGWIKFHPEAANLRVLSTEPREGRWLYSAQQELGWLRITADGEVEVAERIPVPELDNVFSQVTDRSGDIWLEMGVGRIGRIRFVSGRPVLTQYGAEAGLAPNWAQLFAIDGVVRVNISNRILRFNEAGGRFEPDAEFLRGLPSFTVITGRPGRDTRGRLWIGADNELQVFEPVAGGGWKKAAETLPSGLLPYHFRFEEDGVVWMHTEGRFVRYDPNLPAAARHVPRVLLTRVSLLNSKRTLFAVDEPLPALGYGDNSLMVHFVAPGDPFGESVSFEVLLEGAGRDWTPAGSSGSATFTNLGEGRYTLRVRARAGGALGAEDSLTFVVEPPWHRSGAAYAGYALVLLGLVWAAILLQRREKQRLEQLVAQRTKELNDTNSRLANQVEEIRLLSQAIEQSPVAILITNPSGVIVFGNPRLCEITGYAADELLGQDVAFLRSAKEQAEPWRTIAENLQRGDSWHGQFFNRHKSGREVPVRVTVSPLRSPGGEIRLHLFLEEDITEWLAEQERRRKLELQLNQSQKLESLGTLAGGIAHDFNNILTGILGYTELAKLTAATDPGMQQQLAEITKAGLRAKDLVSQILTFSRQSSAQLLPIDLAGPVEEAVRLLRASTPSSIEIVASLESGTVRADATQIQQVMLNLGTNAVHAMRGRNGRIEIALRRMAANPQLAAEITNLPKGPCLCLRVRDYGEGMDAATLERIFDPFFTTKKQGEGTGLGLAIVQGIIAGHHGACRVQSTVGAGTVFELYFPLRWEQTVAPAPVGPAPQGGREEILVVDDETMVAEYITNRLRRLDYQVTTFNDPRAALEACRAAPGRFQGIVTDLTMPHLTGVDLIRQIRELGRVIPAVIVTGYGRNDGSHELPRCEMLHKPFSGEDLARTLAQVLRR